MLQSSQKTSKTTAVAKKLLIDPNPATDFVYVTTINKVVLTSLRIYNQTGILLSEKKINGSQVKLNKSDFLGQSGIYFIQATDNKQIKYSSVVQIVE